MHLKTKQSSKTHFHKQSTTHLHISGLDHLRRALTCYAKCAGFLWPQGPVLLEKAHTTLYKLVRMRVCMLLVLVTYV